MSERDSFGTPSILTLAQGQLKAAEERARLALERRDAAQVELNNANAAVQAWKVIVEQNTVPLSPETLGFVEQHRETQILSEELVNMTQWVRNEIGAATPPGLTVRQLQDSAKQSGRKIGENFPYTIISRLRKRGEVDLREGRFVLIKNP